MIQTRLCILGRARTATCSMRPASKRTWRVPRLLIVGRSRLSRCAPGVQAAAR